MSKFAMIRTVGIICKHDKPEAWDYAKGLVAWLTEHGIDSLVDPDAAEYLDMKPTPKESIPDKADVIVVFGGDGTLLSVARLIGARGKPIMGVNLGRLGFLTTVPVDKLYSTMETVLSGQYNVQERVILDSCIRREGNIIAEHSVLNDVVINKGALARIIDLEAYIDGRYLATFRSDGLIIHTPTGSTGYCLSAGGPIVYPTLSCLGLVPICPHTLANRPLILPDTAELEVVIQSETEEVYLTLDGQVGLLLKYMDIVEAKVSQNKVYFITSQQEDYYHMLRTKLKWGER